MRGVAANLKLDTAMAEAAPLSPCTMFRVPEVVRVEVQVRAMRSGAMTAGWEGMQGVRGMPA